MYLSGLFVYPVKSLRGFAVESAEIDALGIVGDRRFLLIDPQGRFLTQRALPRMAQIATGLTADSLTLSVEGAGSVTVGRASDPMAQLRTVTVWRSENLLAEDCGDEVAAWLSGFLSTSCRLVRSGAGFRRPVLKSAAQPGDVFNFADAVPFLTVSEASLQDLNTRIEDGGGEPVPMGRFRPNFVITGCDAYAEDTWPRVRIGKMVFRAAGPSTRCAITTTDQLTGARGREPLRTLATYRRDPRDESDVMFGQNHIHESKFGRVRVGDEVVPA